MEKRIEDMRLEALQLALALEPRPASADVLVEHAKIIEAYILGKDVKND